MRRKFGKLVHDIAEILHDMRLKIPRLRLRRDGVRYSRVILNDKEPVHTAPPKTVSSKSTDKAARKLRLYLK